MTPASPLQQITTWLDTYLNHAHTPDYPTAYNGLQVENNGEVSHIGCAVDASLDTIYQAIEQGVDLLLVHHGLYWQGVEMLTGSWREKCKLLLEHNIAVYSSHIPLDIHPEVGNNILLAQALGMQDITPCLPWKSINIALRGTLGIHRDELIERLTSITHVTPFTCLRGPEIIDDLFLITGGAGSQITEIHQLGGENFLTGEGTQWTVPYAEEKQMNYFLGNHYATETLGVKALADMIKTRFNLNKSTFLRTNNQL